MPESLQKTLVIVPALNEMNTVGTVVAEVRAALPLVHILVVDDGSTDQTRTTARAAGAAVITLPYNIGVGAAMRTGFKYALRHGYDIAIQVDGDGQHDPTSIVALAAALQDADIVIGARFGEDGAFAVTRPRRFAMRLLAWVLSRVAGQPLTDVTSGFRACNARAMRLFATQYPVEYLGDTVEALLIAARSGLRITEVPVAMRSRSHGSSSQNWIQASLYVGRATLAVLLISLRRRPSAGEADTQPNLGAIA